MKWRFIYRGLKARYRDQRLELLAMTKALRPDDIAVDVGANKGSYLWALSRAVPRGQVVAFEPQPLLSAYLIRACRSANLNNVQIEPVGVSSREQMLTLAIPGGSSTSPGASFEAAVRDRETCKTLEIQTVTLDRYFERTVRRIGAIKIDVEGHELAVLEGARQLLKAHCPVVVCESERRHMSTGGVADVFHFLADLGYQGQFVSGVALQDVSAFDADVHQSEVGNRYWDSPNYCNNFIFKAGDGIS